MRKVVLKPSCAADDVELGIGLNMIGKVRLVSISSCESCGATRRIFNQRECVGFSRGRCRFEQSPALFSCGMSGERTTNGDELGMSLVEEG